MKKVKMEGWDVGIFSIGPESAKSLLEAMTENQRTSSESSIRNLVSEITDGRFGVSNDALVKTASGVWLNGKHRLQAVVRTGKEQSFIILTVPNLEESKTLRIMDCGVTRTVAHVAEMEQGIKNSGIVASVSKMMLAYDRGLITAQGAYANTNRTTQGKYVSRGQLLDYIKSHAAALQYSASKAKSLNAEYGLWGTSGPAFVHYLISRKHSATKADKFLGVLFSGRGENCECTDTLRKAMNKDLKSIRKVSSHVKTASIVHAFRAWEYGVKPRGFVTPGEKFPRA